MKAAFFLVGATGYAVFLDRSMDALNGADYSLSDNLAGLFLWSFVCPLFGLLLAPLFLLVAATGLSLISSET
jgi:hypothetical protein